ncbi:MAG: hypothetical protein HUU10_14945 [Bacteroidetes bacterium]|nr:hypothetical protein [Bacteroidota bacterium]
MPLSKLDLLIPAAPVEREIRPPLTSLLSGKSAWTFTDLESAGLDPDFLNRMKNLVWADFPAGKVAGLVRETGTMEAPGIPLFLSGLREVYLKSLHIAPETVIGLFIRQSQIDILFKLAPLLAADLLISHETGTLSRQQISDFLGQIPGDFLIRDVLTKYLEQRPDPEFPADRFFSNLTRICKAWWQEHEEVVPDVYLKETFNQTGLDSIDVKILTSFVSGIPDPLYTERVRRWTAAQPVDSILSASDAVHVVSGILVPPVSSSVSLDFSQSESVEDLPEQTDMTSVASLSDFLTEAIREEVRQKENAGSAPGFESVEPHRSHYEFEPVQEETPATGDLIPRFVPREPAEEPSEAQHSPPVDEPISLTSPFSETEAPAAELQISDSEATIEPVEVEPEPAPTPMTPKSLFDRIMEEPLEPARFEEVRPAETADLPEPKPEKSLFEKIMESGETVSPVSAVNLDTLPDAELPDAPAIEEQQVLIKAEPEQADLFVSPDSAGPVLPALEQMITENQARLFIRYVFRKDEQRFFQAIHDLNDLTDWQEAKAYLDRVFHEFKVDLYSNEALEFTDIVYSRFN